MSHNPDQRTPGPRDTSSFSRSWQFEDAIEPDHPASTQSLPPGASVGPSLWKAVKDRVHVTAALRQSQRRDSRTDQDPRIDAEGLSTDTIRSQSNGHSRPGQHADHWQSLAHLFAHDEDEAVSPTSFKQTRQRRKTAFSTKPGSKTRYRVSQHASTGSTAGSADRLNIRDETSSSDDDASTSQLASSQRRGRTLVTPTLRSAGNAAGEAAEHSSVSFQENRRKVVSWTRIVSPPARDRDDQEESRGVSSSTLSDEPSSWLRNDPDEAPEGEDPLLYTSQDMLLDSDSTVSDEDLEEDEARLGPLSSSDQRFESGQAPAVAKAKSNRFAVLLAKAKRCLELTPLQKSIAKCGIAYFVASLFTFSPTISLGMARLLPNHDPDARVPFSNLHMIATVATYFHPAKTLGAMLEADFFALLAFVFAVVLGFTSMAIAVYLHEADMLFVSDILSVLVFLGFGMALVGYAKVKVGKPQFNTACSLVNIIVFTVVVKEGSTHLGSFSTEKTFQVTLVVIAGSLISNLVCFLFWPQSATANLQDDIVKNLQGFATLLRVLTKTFLLDDPSNFHFKSDKIKRAIDDHHQSFTSLKKDLAEAMLESFFDLRMRGMRSKYVDATDSMNRLAQHLAGLRSSCGLQHQIMMAQVQARKARGTLLDQTKGDSSQGPAAGLAKTAPGLGSRGGTEIANVIFQHKEGQQRPPASSPGADGSERGKVEQSATAFEDFIESVGPHMRSLVFTCSRTLKNLRTTFITKRDFPKGSKPALAKSQPDGGEDVDGRPQLGSRFHPGASFDILERDIASALRRFQHEQTVAIKRIYTLEPKKMEAERAAAESASREAGDRGAATDLGPNTRLRASPDEEIFLIFFFVFNLEEFAKELEVLIEALEALRQGEERLVKARATSLWSRAKLFFSIMIPSWKRIAKRLRRSRTSSAARQRERQRRAAAALDFPSNRRHAVNTAQTPAALTFKQRYQRLVWSVGEFLRQADTKFAIKAGAGSALLASPAFFETTRPTFTKFQGQWALVSFMVVLSPTVGQSNQMSFHRFLGTILGALTAVGIYNLFPDNNVVLPIFGVLFSLPCFKFIVGKPQYASSGRFVLLTYNLTALYSYNLRKTGIEVEQIAIQRTVSVLVGVLWATVLNQLVWPFEARRELALGVSDLIFKLAWLYQRLVVSYSEDQSLTATAERGEGAEHPSEELDDDDGDNGDDAELDVETQPLLRSRESSKGDEFQAIELHLQVTIIKLEGLLAQTKNEPRLKGPFPVATYKAMLGCCQNILDKLHSMRCVTSRDDWYRQVRRDFVIPVNPERRAMVGNVLLYFYTLGSAFHLKIPVPPYFPPASECRLRLLDKIRELPVVRRRAVRGSSAYLLFYSYALAMKDVIDQLEELGRLTQHNFGIWGGSIDEFERHFRTSPESADPTPYASRRSSRHIF